MTCKQCQGTGKVSVPTLASFSGTHGYQEQLIDCPNKKHMIVGAGKITVCGIENPGHFVHKLERYDEAEKYVTCSKCLDVFLVKCPECQQIVKLQKFDTSGLPIDENHRYRIANHYQRLGNTPCAGTMLLYYQGMEVIQKPQES